MEDSMIMMLAIIQSRDSEDTVAALTEKGFYVTVLSTTGGFLKQKSTTLLIGTLSGEQEHVKSILREKAGVREEPDYSSCLYVAPSEGNMQIRSVLPPALPPVMRTVGGVTAFTIKLDNLEKF